MTAVLYLELLRWHRTLGRGAAKRVAWAARKGLRTDPLSHLAHPSAAGFGRTMVEMKSTTSIVRDRRNWGSEDGGTTTDSVQQKTSPNAREGYSLHLILIHQPPANGVLTTEVVNPPLGNRQE